MSDLYIMQNHVGFIKVGRSVNVETRRQALERTDLCDITTVAIIDGAGEFEETMHINLGEHRLIGEWFEGDDWCRESVAVEVEALSEVLGRAAPKLLWPYPVASEKQAAEWLDRCEQTRTVASINRAYGLRLRSLRAGAPEVPDEGRYEDVSLWTLLWRFERQEGTLVMPVKGQGGDIELVGHRSGSPEGETVPRYTTDVAAALLLWPDQDRPQAWPGSAWDCCIAALLARKSRLARDGLTALTSNEVS